MKTLKSLTGIVAMAVGLALIASPTFAGDPSPKVPEPGTLSIFAAGIVGAIIVARLRNKK